MSARDLAYTAVFAAFTAVLGLLPGLYLFGSTVPVVLQNAGPMLAGTLLGAKRGFCSTALLVVLVLVGFPLLSGGRGGISVLAGPSGGFVLAWALAAGLTGLLMQLWRGRPNVGVAVLANLAGSLVLAYLIAIPYWAVVSGSLGYAFVHSMVFVPGDVAKMVLVSVVATGVHRAYPDLLPRIRRSGRREG